MAGRDVPLSLRRTIVEISLDGLNVREFCRSHGVSTWFFYDLRRRYRAEGEAALELRSRAAKRVANRTRPEMEDLIVAVRKQLADDGLDCGPATIRFHHGNADGEFRSGDGEERKALRSDLEKAHGKAEEKASSVKNDKQIPEKGAGK